MPDPLIDAPPPSLTDRFAASDGLPLFMQAWLPDRPEGTVVLVHGYSEHSGRYAHMAARLAAEDFGVFAYDHRGHGRSPGPRALVTRFEQLVDDLACFLDEVGRRTDGPLWLLGHSMGGTVVLALALRGAAPVHGLVLSAPAVRLPQPSVLQPFAGIASRLVPRLPTLAIGQDGVSHDPEVQRAQERDPLVYHGRIQARTGYEIQRGARYVEHHAESLTLPFHLVQGTADTVVDPDGARLLYARAASTDKTLRLYPGLFHEAFNERLPERLRVLDEVASWLAVRRQAVSRRSAAPA